MGSNKGNVFGESEPNKRFIWSSIHFCTEEAETKGETFSMVKTITFTE